jgi:hypothetical protein
MKTFLPFFKSITTKLFLLIACFITTNVAIAQPNLLANASFETTLMPNINANNILGVGVPYGGWYCTNGGFNIIHVNGAGYSQGQDTAANGSQYVDVTSSDGFISKTFTTPSFLFFNGSFGTRDAGRSDYVNWNGSIVILNSSNTIVASSNTMSFTTTTNKNAWYTLAGSSTQLPAGTYTYRSYIGNFGHFDKASVVASSTPLPIKLESFTAIAKDKAVRLNWVVSEEVNFSHYIIEKSIDGINFNQAGVVLGNISNSINYSFSDNLNTIQTGLIYYRLRSVDIDGKSEISATRIIRFTIQAEKNISIITYPNPVSNEVRITIPASWQNKKVVYEIFNASGRTAKRIETANSSQTEIVNVSTLSPGFYIVRVSFEGQTAQQKIIKQ